MSDSPPIPQPAPTTTAAPRPAAPPVTPPAQQGAQTAPPRPAAPLASPLTAEQITAMIAQAMPQARAAPIASPTPSLWTDPTIIVGVFASLLGIIIYSVVTRSDTLMASLAASVVSMAFTIVNFKWGSSQGSRDKDATIAAVTKQ